MKLASLTRKFKKLVLTLALGIGLATQALAAPGNFWRVSDNNYFQKNGGTWTEHNANGQLRATFQETDRNDNYVRLYDRSRDLTIDLWDNKAWLWQPGSTEWLVLCEGQWENRPEQPQPQPSENPNRIYVDDSDWGLNGSSQRPGLHLVVIPKVSTLRDGSRYLFVDLNGTELHANKGGQLEADSLFDRGWYLENVTTTISVLDSNVRLGSNAVFVAGNNGSVTVSQSRSFGQEIGLGTDGPNIGINTSEERTDAYTTNFTGFTPMASDTGRTGENYSFAKNVYRMTGCLDYSNGTALRGYTKWQDLVDAPQSNSDAFWTGFSGVFSGKAFESFRLHSPPAQAKSGFPVISQVGFLAPAGYSQPATVRVQIDFQIRRVSVSGETKLDSTYKTHGYYPLSITRDIPVHFGFPQN